MKRVGWVRTSRFYVRHTRTAAVCVNNVALDSIPLVLSGCPALRERPLYDRFILRTHFVSNMITAGHGKPAVSFGTIGQLAAYVRFVQAHRIVASVRTEAAAVVLVKYLYLKAIGFETSQEILTCIVASE